MIPRLIRTPQERLLRCFESPWQGIVAGESEDRVTAGIARLVCRRRPDCQHHIVRPKVVGVSLWACSKGQLSDYGIPQHTDRLDFTFDSVAGKAIAGRSDNALLGLPSATELMIDGPRGTCRRAGDDQHARLECEIDREKWISSAQVQIMLQVLLV